MALIAATTAVSAFGSIAQGMAQKGAADAEAYQQQQQAQLEMQQAGAKISSDDYEAVQTLAKINANTGAAGVTSQGSPGLVATRSAEEQKINDMYTMYSGRMAATRDLYAADVSRYKGQQAETAGFLGAGGSLLEGFTKGYRLYKGGSTSSSSSSSGGSLGGSSASGSGNG
jgi:hypothetical protein